jgi:hypothetical protein
MEILSWVNKKKLNLCYLSTNENAIDFLEKNQELIIWEYLSININAIELLETNQEKINWHYLSANINAIELL